ncbi:MAG: hypothetical protein QOE30_215 [Mycobacterium sp.]|jgi:hypothetical protein|nr:hypothetical protein [Mycobacterium sp.]
MCRRGVDESLVANETPVAHTAETSDDTSVDLRGRTLSHVLRIWIRMPLDLDPSQILGPMRACRCPRGGPHHPPPATTENSTTPR